LSKDWRSRKKNDRSYPVKTYWTFVLRALGGFRKSTNEPNSGFPARWSGFVQEKSQDQRHDDFRKVTV
jgi:hypothetical protein